MQFRHLAELLRLPFLATDIPTWMFLSGTDCLSQFDEFEFRPLLHFRKVNLLGHSLIGIDIVLKSEKNQCNEEAIRKSGTHAVEVNQFSRRTK